MKKLTLVITGETYLSIIQYLSGHISDLFMSIHRSLENRKNKKGRVAKGEIGNISYSLVDESEG